MLAATIWFTALTGAMDLGEISSIRSQLMAVWAISGILVVIFVPGFLAARGLGCLLLLGAALVLDAAYLDDSWAHGDPQSHGLPVGDRRHVPRPTARTTAAI